MGRKIQVQDLCNANLDLEIVPVYRRKSQLVVKGRLLVEGKIEGVTSFLFTLYSGSTVCREIKSQKNDSTAYPPRGGVNLKVRITQIDRAWQAVIVKTYDPKFPCTIKQF